MTKRFLVTTMMAVAGLVACLGAAVFQMDDADHYRKLEHFPVQKKVHSLAADPETHRVYAPEQEVHGKAAAPMAVYEAGVNPVPRDSTLSRCCAVPVVHPASPRVGSIIARALE